MRALSLICLVLALQGCATRHYQPVPLCGTVSPPNPERYIPASPDERLVLMTDAYINMMHKAADCNAMIKLINAANSTK